MTLPVVSLVDPAVDQPVDSPLILSVDLPLLVISTGGPCTGEQVPERASLFTAT